MASPMRSLVSTHPSLVPLLLSLSLLSLVLSDVNPGDARYQVQSSLDKFTQALSLNDTTTASLIFGPTATVAPPNRPAVVLSDPLSKSAFLSDFVKNFSSTSKGSFVQLQITVVDFVLGKPLLSYRDENIPSLRDPSLSDPNLGSGSKNYVFVTRAFYLVQDSSKGDSILDVGKIWLVWESNPVPSGPSLGQTLKNDVYSWLLTLAIWSSDFSLPTSPALSLSPFFSLSAHKSLAHSPIPYRDHKSVSVDQTTEPEHFAVREFSYTSLERTLWSKKLEPRLGNSPSVLALETQIRAAVLAFSEALCAGDAVNAAYEIFAPGPVTVSPPEEISKNLPDFVTKVNYFQDLINKGVCLSLSVDTFTPLSYKYPKFTNDDSYGGLTLGRYNVTNTTTGASLDSGTTLLLWRLGSKPVPSNPVDPRGPFGPAVGPSGPLKSDSFSSKFRSLLGNIFGSGKTGSDKAELVKATGGASFESGGNGPSQPKQVGAFVAVWTSDKPLPKPVCYPVLRLAVSVPISSADSLTRTEGVTPTSGSGSYPQAAYDSYARVSSGVSATVHDSLAGGGSGAPLSQFLNNPRRLANEDWRSNVSNATRLFFDAVSRGNFSEAAAFVANGAWFAPPHAKKPTILRNKLAASKFLKKIFKYVEASVFQVSLVDVFDGENATQPAAPVFLRADASPEVRLSAVEGTLQNTKNPLMLSRHAYVVYSSEDGSVLDVGKLVVLWRESAALKVDERTSLLEAPAALEAYWAVWNSDLKRNHSLKGVEEERGGEETWEVEAEGEESGKERYGSAFVGTRVSAGGKENGEVAEPVFEEIEGALGNLSSAISARDPNGVLGVLSSSGPVLVLGAGRPAKELLTNEEKEQWVTKRLLKNGTSLSFQLLEAVPTAFPEAPSLSHSVLDFSSSLLNGVKVTDAVSRGVAQFNRTVVVGNITEIISRKSQFFILWRKEFLKVNTNPLSVELNLAPVQGQHPYKWHISWLLWTPLGKR